ISINSAIPDYFHQFLHILLGKLKVFKFDAMHCRQRYTNITGYQKVYIYLFQNFSINTFLQKVHYLILATYRFLYFCLVLFVVGRREKLLKKAEYRPVFQIKLNEVAPHMKKRRFIIKIIFDPVKNIIVQ